MTEKSEVPKQTHQERKISSERGGYLSGFVRRGEAEKIGGTWKFSPEGIGRARKEMEEELEEIDSRPIQADWVEATYEEEKHGRSADVGRVMREEDLGLYGVLDAEPWGGKRLDAQLAKDIAEDRIKSHIRENAPSVKTLQEAKRVLGEAYKESDKELFGRQRGLDVSATTAWFVDVEEKGKMKKYLVLAHVGNTAGFLRDKKTGAILRLTEEQSVGRQLYDQGKIDSKEFLTEKTRSSALNTLGDPRGHTRISVMSLEWKGDKELFLSNPDTAIGFGEEGIRAVLNTQGPGKKRLRNLEEASFAKPKKEFVPVRAVLLEGRSFLKEEPDLRERLRKKTQGVLERIDFPRGVTGEASHLKEPFEVLERLEERRKAKAKVAEAAVDASTEGTLVAFGVEVGRLRFGVRLEKTK